MGVTRYVNMAFIAVGILSWIVFAELFAWAMDLISVGLNSPLIGVNFRIADAIALLAAAILVVYLRRHEKISTFSMEVGNELSKVKWPTWSETKMSTFVVVVVTLIISVILAFFDYLWSAISSLIYNV